MKNIVNVLLFLLLFLVALPQQSSLFRATTPNSFMDIFSPTPSTPTPMPMVLVKLTSRPMSEVFSRVRTDSPLRPVSSTTSSSSWSTTRLTTRRPREKLDTYDPRRAVTRTFVPKQIVTAEERSGSSSSLFVTPTRRSSFKRSYSYQTHPSVGIDYSMEKATTLAASPPRTYTPPTKSYSPPTTTTMKPSTSGPMSGYSALPIEQLFDYKSNLIIPRKSPTFKYQSPVLPTKPPTANNNNNNQGHDQIDLERPRFHLRDPVHETDGGDESEDADQAVAEEPVPGEGQSQGRPGRWVWDTAGSPNPGHSKAHLKPQKREPIRHEDNDYYDNDDKGSNFKRSTYSSSKEDQDNKQDLYRI